MHELQAFGFDPKTYKVTVNAWPDTIPAWELWDRVGNQWRMGHGGAFALDYNTVFYLLDRMGLAQEEQNVLFDSIRTIEAEVLEIWDEERERAAAAG